MKASWIKITWTLSVFSIFIWTAMTYHTATSEIHQYEILLRHALLMQIGSAPLGLALTLLVGILLNSIGTSVSGLNEALLMSFTCGIGGAIQWFYLTPLLLNKITKSIEKKKD